ncbi:transmembrane protein [Gossypium australe]|uniref:Transmembrane protein n=1 Tax=Gossypium australe TaxID=47621 RepID=A0A5B6X8G9_9ROSI|nr:transmembrane protein [Gossypium australe]
MELSLQTLTFTSYCRTLGDSWPKVQSALDHRAFSLITSKPKEHRRKLATPSLALPETAASVAIAATVVGAAATFLVRRTKASDATEVPLRTCEDCEGSGICSECRGEGFVLPKKWSYCTKCSSTRSCTTCGGSGKLS